jgi:serine protease inhibitor
VANKEKQEYDYEGDMAMSQLKSIIANAQRMHDMLKVDTNLPEWVQSKITLAEDYISTASNYMQGEMKEEVAVNSVGAGNVAGLQGEPPVNKKKKNVMSFNRFMKK